MEILAICARCEHCNQQKLLVARVRSDCFSMKVCATCAVEAVRLKRQYEGLADGELQITPLSGEEIHFEVIR